MKIFLWALGIAGALTIAAGAAYGEAVPVLLGAMALILATVMGALAHPATRRGR